MLESVKFLLEKIKTCRDNCSYPRSCWWLCRILTSPISLIGLLFVQMGMLMKYCENKLENMMEKGEITIKIIHWFFALLVRHPYTCVRKDLTVMIFAQMVISILLLKQYLKNE